MNYQIDEISGNSYTITLSPVTSREKQDLEGNTNKEAIEEHYKQAIREKFGEHIRVASLTPNNNYPYSATVEMMTESGSV